MTTARKVLQSVRALPPAERLRLVSVVADELLGATDPPPCDLDDDDTWTDQDWRNLTAYREFQSMIRS